MRHSLMKLVVAAIALSAALPAALVHADEWPTKPIRFIVPVPPGTGPDVDIRQIGRHLSTILGQPIVIENRPGAASRIGVEAAIRSAPDGYTFLVSTLSAHAGNPAAVKLLPYHPIDDFAPVTVINAVPLLLVAHPGFPAETVADIVRLAKQQPGRISYASFGTGGMAHLAGVQLELRGGVKMTHVPYKGGAPALADLLGGHVQLYFSGINSVLGHIKSARLRAIAVSGATRSKALPNVPAVAETYADFEAGVTPAVWFPARTPPEIVNRMRAALVKVINTPKFRQAAERDGEGDPVGNRPEEMAAIVKQDIERYAALMKAAGIKPE